MIDLLATGYPSLDYILPISHSPAVGETALLRALPAETEPQYGGCGANVAVGLARLGIRAGVAMVIGDDAFGARYLAYLDQQGVDRRDVLVLPGQHTSQSYLFRSPQGEYQNFFFPGAADAWAGNLRLNSITEARYALVTVGPFDYNSQFVAQAIDANVPLIWQLKGDVFAFKPQALETFAHASQIILMNHLEAQYVRTTLNLSHMEDLLSETTQAIVVTYGARGSTLFVRGAQSPHQVPAIPTTVVDTTGAGDGFTAGFLAGVLKGYDLAVSAHMGATVASYVLQAVGCQTSLPDWQALITRFELYFGALPELNN